MGAILEDVIYAFLQRTLYVAVFLTGRIHGSSHQGTEAGVALMTLPILLILGSVGLEVLVPKESILLPGGTQSFYLTIR